MKLNSHGTPIANVYGGPLDGGYVACNGLEMGDELVLRQGMLGQAWTNCPAYRFVQCAPNEQDFLIFAGWENARAKK